MSVETLQAKAMQVPFVDLPKQHGALREELLEAVGRVLDHGKFILGPETAELEERWARSCGTNFAIGVGDGTAALTLTLRALGIGEGDDVITASNTFVAGVSSIVHAGARPRLADVGDDFNLDPDAVEAAVTDQTKAIIAVHLAGRPARMREIGEIADEHELIVIEDAAQAFGARCQNEPVGSLGTAGCFSLHPLKTAGACGDAGMITTDNAMLAERLRLLRNHGITRRQEDCKLWGFNSRLDTLQAALVLAKWSYLEHWIDRRRCHADIYRQRLSDIVRIPTDRPDDRATYHTFPVEADHRDALAEHLQRHEIGCAIHYRTPIHLLEAACGLGYRRGDFPAAERQAERIISLPVHEGLNEEQVHYVCDVMETFYG